METKVKRARAPPFVAPFLDLDEKFSKEIYTWFSRTDNFSIVRSNLKTLEISCHGIPWLLGCIISFWLMPNKYAQAFSVNLFIALLVDIFFVAVIKAFVRRRRPSYNTNDMFATIGVDKFSFPSGHSSRSTLIALICFFLCDIFFLIRFAIIVWACAVTLSRVISGRHYIADMVGGIILGIIEFFICCGIWLSDDQSLAIIKWLSDEKSIGPDFDV